MKHCTFTNRKSNRRLHAILALTVLLGACSAALAKSTLVSISLQPQWPTNSQPGSVVLYTVTVTRAGEGELEVSLLPSGLPAGATASFSLNPVRFTGRKPTTFTSTLTLVCTNLTATDAYPFLITGVSKREVVTLTNAPASNGSVSAAAQPAAGPTLALDRLNSTTLRLRGQGASGQTYQIETTSSLGSAVWAPAGSSTADGNGRFTFVDASSNLPALRFYRAVMPAAPVQTP